MYYSRKDTNRKSKKIHLFHGELDKNKKKDGGEGGS